MLITKHMCQDSRIRLDLSQVEQKTAAEGQCLKIWMMCESRPNLFRVEILAPCCKRNSAICAWSRKILDAAFQKVLQQVLVSNRFLVLLVNYLKFHLGKARHLERLVPLFWYLLVLTAVIVEAMLQEHSSGSALSSLVLTQFIRLCSSGMAQTLVSELEQAAHMTP